MKIHKIDIERVVIWIVTRVVCQINALEMLLERVEKPHGANKALQAAVVRRGQLLEKHPAGGLVAKNRTALEERVRSVFEYARGTARYMDHFGDYSWPGWDALLNTLAPFCQSTKEANNEGLLVPYLGVLPDEARALRFICRVARARLALEQGKPVPTRNLACLLGVSDDHVNFLCKRGKFKRASRGHYDSRSILEWLWRRGDRRAWQPSWGPLNWIEACLMAHSERESQARQKRLRLASELAAKRRGVGKKNMGKRLRAAAGAPNGALTLEPEPPTSPCDYLDETSHAHIDGGFVRLPDHIRDHLGLTPERSVVAFRAGLDECTLVRSESSAFEPDADPLLAWVSAQGIVHVPDVIMKSLESEADWGGGVVFFVGEDASAHLVRDDVWEKRVAKHPKQQEQGQEEQEPDHA